MTLSSTAAFERGAVRGAVLEDLDLTAASEYLTRRAPKLLERQPIEQLLERIGFVARGVPTVAGLLLFGDFPQIHRPEWGVVAVQFDGRLLTDTVTARVDLEGTLSEMAEAAEAFVVDHSQSLPDQVDPRETAEEYSRGAVREALANALIHRDWGLPGRIAVRLFTDRLEIWSPGGPPPSLAIPLDALSSDGGVSLARNPLIASTCRHQGLGEQLGRGLPTLRRQVTEAAGQPPMITSSKIEVCVVVPSALHGGVRLS